MYIPPPEKPNCTNCGLPEDTIEICKHCKKEIPPLDITGKDLFIGGLAVLFVILI